MIQTTAAPAGESRPPWGRAVVAGVAATLAGSAAGLALIGLTVEAVKLAAGWPSRPAEISSSMFPQSGVAGGPLTLALLFAAFLLDAAVRLWAFRRLATAELSLAAAMVSILIAPAYLSSLHPPGWLPMLAVSGVFLAWHSRSPHPSAA